MTSSPVRAWKDLLLTVMVLRCGSTCASTTAGPNVCTYVIQYPVVEVQNFTVLRTTKQRCIIGSVTDLFRGRCKNKYISRYITERSTRSVTRLITRIERTCCNGTNEINGTCVTDEMPAAEKSLESTSNSSNGALVPILVVVAVVGLVVASFIVYIFRRQNMYKTPRKPKILGMENAVYQIEKDKSTSNHTYVLPDDPSYLKLDSRKINRNVYETVPANKGPTSTATVDDSYEKLNMQKEVAINQNVYEQIKTYTQLNQK